jgi:hypothetical protein
MKQNHAYDSYDAIPTWTKDRCLEVLHLSETAMKTAYGDRNRKITAGVVRNTILARLQATLANEQQHHVLPMTNTLSPEVGRLIDLINLQKHLIELCCPAVARHPPIMQTANTTLDNQVKSLHQHNLHLLSLFQQYQQSTSSNTQNDNNQHVEPQAVPLQPAPAPQPQQNPHHSLPRKSNMKKTKKNPIESKKQVQFQDTTAIAGIQLNNNTDEAARQQGMINAGLASLPQPTTAKPQSAFPGYAEEDLMFTGEEDNGEDQDTSSSDETDGFYNTNTMIPQEPRFTCNLPSWAASSFNIPMQVIHMPPQQQPAP